MPRSPAIPARETTRASLPILMALLTLALAGCATPGPNHAYVAGSGHAPILDLQPGVLPAGIPSYLGATDTLYGLAYEPFTDHLYLRIAPGNSLRVIDRPAHAIKRITFIEGLPPGRGDLAIRSQDRHLFFAHPAEPAVVETTLYGKFVRTIPLATLAAPPAGVAYDQKAGRLLILSGGDLARVTTHDLDGRRIGGVALDRDVRLTALGYDSEAGEFYVPLRTEAAIGIFGLDGHLRRTLPQPDGLPRDYLDVGPKSFLRMF